MRKEVYITGHRNPDTDSIAAAIGYAELKGKRGDIHPIPLRLGELNQETRFVLDYFNVPEPMYKDTMKPQLTDLSIDPTFSVSQDISLKKAWQLMQEHHLNSISVVDEEEKLIGIVSLSNVTKCYMEVWDDGIIGRSQTSVENIVDALAGETLVYPHSPRQRTGRMTVYAMEPDKAKGKIHENDLVIVGDREDAQRDALERKASVLILTGSTLLSEKLITLAEKQGTLVISTPYDSFMAARLLPQSVPVSYVMTQENLVCFRPDDYVEDVRSIMGKTRYRSYPVVDHQNKVIGSISRYHLISSEKKQLILVDHNERNQSIPDIEEAEILEIIDHHRVANISTNGPVYFRNEPVGSTSTIVGSMFFEQGIRPSQEVAGLLSAAIISDTLLFRSPTSTPTDKMILERLARIANINIEEFAMEMFRVGTSLENKKPGDLLKSDVKLFTIEGEKVRVCQVFTLDLEGLQSIQDELIHLMEETVKDKNESLFVLMMTDIFKEQSKLISVGEYAAYMQDVFSGTVYEGIIHAPGILSRKKQVIPKISAMITEIKNA